MSDVEAPLGTLGDLAARVVRIEKDIDHLRSTLEPLPTMLQTSLERLAVVNERIASHLEESKRAWILLENHDKALIELRERLKAVDNVIDLVKKLLWTVAVGMAAALWWGVQKWVEHQNTIG